MAALTLDAALSAGGKQSNAQPFQYAGSPVDKAGALIPFDAGNRLSLIVAVTAEDGSSQQYIVDVLRAPPDGNNLLAALSVTANVPGPVLMNPPWSPARFANMAVVPFASRAVTVMFQPQSRVAVAVLEQVIEQGNRAVVPVTGDPGSAAGAVIEFAPPRQRLRVGIAVTAQDGGVQRYVVEVRRSEPDRNADLAAIVVSTGVLSPAFSPRIASYGIFLPAAVEAAKISAVTASPVARMALVEQPDMRPAQSVSLTLPVAAGGQAVITFAVSAEDGSQKLYRVQIRREAAPVAPAPVAPAPVAPPPPAGNDTPGAAPAPADRPGPSDKPRAGQQDAAASQPQPGDTGKDHVQLTARRTGR